MDSKIEFKSGLNIIVGANGSGKTSILRSITHYLGADHIGVSAFSKKWMMGIDWVVDESDNQIAISPFTVVHDGQPIVYGDPRKAIGITSSGADDELGVTGLLEHMNMGQESSGEQSNRRLTPFLQILQSKGDFPESIADLINVESSNDVWKSRFNYLYENWFAGTIEKGQPTIILDEAETGLGLMNQILLWERILKNPEVADKFQIIIVSHSIQCIGIEHANYIEMQPGYYDACQKIVRGELGFEDAAKFSTNMPHKLNKRELETLKEIRSLDGEFVLGKKEKTCLRLESLSLIEQYTRKPERVEGGGSFFRSLERESIYAITDRGIQLLDIQLGGV